MQINLKVLLKSKSFKVGFWIVMTLLTIMLISFFWTPNNPNTVFDNLNSNNLITPPSFKFPLGTDYMGRCNASRIMVSLQWVFYIGVFSVMISLIFGAILGFLTGYFTGFVDSFFMGIINVISSIPDILFILVVVSIAGTSGNTLVVTIGLLGVAPIARIIRGAVKEAKNNEYISWAKVIGVPTIRIITHHVLVDIIPTILIIIAIRFSTVVLIESGLGFLGFTSPDRVSLGGMLYDARSYIFTSPFYAIIPGVVIVLIVYGFNLVSDGIEETIIKIKNN